MGRRPALVYLDGGPDLYTPDTGARPIDAMGLAHMLALPVHGGELRAAAARAVAAAEAMSATFVVLFDVDVLRFVAMPIADVPDSGDEPRGLSLDEATEVWPPFVANPRFGGLVLTEVNPDHAPELETLSDFAAAVAEAVAR